MADFRSVSFRRQRLCTKQFLTIFKTKQLLTYKFGVNRVYATLVTIYLLTIIVSLVDMVIIKVLRLYKKCGL